MVRRSVRTESRRDTFDEALEAELEELLCDVNKCTRSSTRMFLSVQREQKRAKPTVRVINVKVRSTGVVAFASWPSQSNLYLSLPK